MNTGGGQIRHGDEVHIHSCATSVLGSDVWDFACGVFYSLYDYVLTENCNLVDSPW